MIAAADGHHAAGSFPATQREGSREAFLRGSSYDSCQDAQDPNFFMRSANRRKRRSAARSLAASARRVAAKVAPSPTPPPAAAPSVSEKAPAILGNEAKDAEGDDVFHRSVSDREDESEEPCSSLPSERKIEKKDATWWKSLNPIYHVVSMPAHMILCQLSPTKDVPVFQAKFGRDGQGL